MKGQPLSQAHKDALAAGRRAAAERRKGGSARRTPKRGKVPRKPRERSVEPTGDVAVAEHMAAPAVTAQSAHVLVFGAIGKRGEFETAFFEIEPAAARELMRRVAATSLAMTSTEELDRLRAENARLSGILQTISGAASGAVAAKANGHANGRDASPSVLGPVRLPDDDIEDGPALSMDFEGMLGDLAALSEVEEPLAPEEISEERVWRPRMDAWVNSRIWVPDWGGRPGQSDCNVPYDILEEFGYR